MAKKRVYVESTVISYLTARRPRDIRRLARQDITLEWWAKRERWSLFLSPVVIEEITAGDPEAAENRVAVTRSLPVLPDHPKERALADELIEKAGIPPKARPDATHLALAALHGMDYLLTWNHKHLDNPASRQRVEDVIRNHGLSPALVLTPERILEAEYD